MKVYGVTGWKNAGKTTMVERLVTEITARGYGVSTVKHAHHSTDVDHPGRDSFRHRTAGAREVLVSSPQRWALMHELRDAAEPSLDELLARLSPVDLVLIEGYKHAPHPKIEVARAALAHAMMAGNNPTIRALASDGAEPPDGLTRFDIDDIAGIADFILREVGL